ncbi:isoleucine--tRNA ligase [Altererythrobacter lauratis]|uniref:Isoleucine--tRNA ligase n=1 Tax=Alteraurantiacibacter lauratis TaxID=2054627 RepID=A0ABV7EDV7_9SPHN
MTQQRDYKDTVFLPKTDFPMKAGLPQKEPGILARWQAEKVYAKLREARAGREKFILHDGPPYANGDIHIGHALNKVLKDAVVRTQSLLGKDAPFIPGWDCHGLPIEWKVEEAYRKKKRNKDEVPAEEFRAECRAYAAQWVEVQKAQFQRLGITGDWERPYLTMAPEAEALIVAELLKFAESGQLYRGAKPVMWSPVEKTALAEAEVEYEDIISTQIDVAFEIVESPIPELVGAYAVIWTTTPWTIPVNQALAYGPEVLYGLYEHEDGRKFICAVQLKNQVNERWLKDAGEIASWYGRDLAGTICRHPMHALGGFFAEPRPMLPGDFVTTDSGTGLVHMAPDHGEDDFALCKEHGINPKFVVEADGRYREDWAWLPRTDERSMSVINPKFNAPDGPVCSDLRQAGALLSASTDYQHSYPHSWRSKAKVIFRCTPQWFVPMDRPMAPFDYDVAPLGGVGAAVALGVRADRTATLRETALKAIADTAFYPDKGRNRIGSMVEGRPDWVLSRQRAWGVPITLFVDRKTGDYLVDPEVNARIIAAVREKGVDAWSEEAAPALLGPNYNPEDYERITDILDVWFDSGSTHAFVLESGTWPELQSPADLYLEGSDQHRGWFQSSLLESCATRGRAPYKAVLTHGFTMDAKGMKMSKSLGNTISPLAVMEEYGADIIRLWALSVDYTADHRIGPEILKGVADQYRKLRNTFRYLLGALHDYTPQEAVGVEDMPELERYMLSLLAELDARMKAAVEAYDFNTYTRALVDFCNEDLSAFFFDIRKDCLYCDHPADMKRRAYRTVLDAMFHALIRYAAPVLVFTAEEVWASRYPDAGSVHLLEWPELSDLKISEELSKKWLFAKLLRDSVLREIEEKRRNKEIRSSLEAKILFKSSGYFKEFGIPWEEFFIVSQVSMFLSEDVTLVQMPVHDLSDERRVIGTSENLYSSFVVQRIEHHKCGRCWRHLPEVTEDGALCGRCEDVVARLDAEAGAPAA